MFSNPEKNISQFNIDPGHVVVDLGSGSGHYTLASATLAGRSGKVFAVDIQKDLLQRLKKAAHEQNLTNVEVVWGDIDEPRGTTLRDAIADRVIIGNTLFQVENKINLIEEARRILKPKGKLLLIDWASSFGGLGPQIEDIISKDSARVMFEAHGFVFDKEFNAGDHHYGLIFKKL